MQYPRQLALLRDCLDVGQDPKEINPSILRAATEAARVCWDNPVVGRPIDKLRLRRGILVSFIYENPGVNEPWRFGIVNQWTNDAWNIFTLNLRWEQVKTPKGIRKQEIGPNYRTYRTDYMRDCREITGYPIEVAPQMAPADEMKQLRDLLRKAADKLKLMGGDDGT